MIARVALAACLVGGCARSIAPGESEEPDAGGGAVVSEWLVSVAF